MSSFKDNKQRTWEIAINTATVKRVRSVHSVDLLKIFIDGSSVMGDLVVFVDILYTLCETQCRDKGVTDTEFGEALVGQAIEDGAYALMESVADFFPTAKAKTFHDLIVKVRQTAAIQQSAADKIINDLPMLLSDATN